MTPAIRAYKRATGVDLAEYGLGNVMIGGMKYTQRKEEKNVYRTKKTNDKLQIK